MMPGGDLAAGIEAGAEIVRRDWTESPVVHVVLARPHDLDRTSGLLRQHDGVHDEIDVAIAAPTESPAHHKVVQLHLVARDAEEFRRRLTDVPLPPRPAPDLYRVAG